MTLSVCPRVWQAKEARRDRERALAQVEMQQALSSGVSWGMAGEDATSSHGDDSDPAGLGLNGTLDWRAYSDTHVRHTLPAAQKATAWGDNLALHALDTLAWSQDAIWRTC